MIVFGLEEEMFKIAIAIIFHTYMEKNRFYVFYVCVSSNEIAFSALTQNLLSEILLSEVRKGDAEFKNLE